MKTVSGHIISSKPVSISRAAKFLSNFVECDNGASGAVTAILQQTAAAFDELSELHKKLKSCGPNRKSISSKASSGISTPRNEPSEVSAWSSEGEKVAEKSKEKNRRKEAGSDLPASLQEIRVDGSKTDQRRGHGEVTGIDLLGNPFNGSEDNSGAVSEKKKRKKKQRQRKDRDDDESAENRGEARERDEESNCRYNTSSKGSEGIGDDLSEKLNEKKRNKKEKGQGGDDNGLLQNGTNTREEEDGKKRKNETSIEGDDGSVECRKKKKAKTRVGAEDQNS
ncbi:hypothetical protein MLD38_026997 [Melastoma candidum]|uniref:Uncharacterized protein n=1 Tax=Melastoma candidum TaxID=119954 RepID=A0ACB9P189_9MYRT|nr:hypothetical protein MLD38_026997 [Melastoma candidum]